MKTTSYFKIKFFFLKKLKGLGITDLYIALFFFLAHL